MDLDGGNKRVFHRLGGPGSGDSRHNKVCFHWQAGKCNRNPCAFRHSESPPPNVNGTSSKRPYGSSENSGFSGPRRSSNFNTWGRGGGGGGGGVAGGNRGVVRKADKVCSYWVQGNCSYGERCKFLHSWSLGDGFSLLSQLDGHQKVVSGIAFPSGSDRLYTGSTDETVRVWDCQSGKCIAVITLGGEVGCMISEGPWLFVGIPNLVKAWNTQNSMELSLSGPVGQVYALVVNNDMLFAGIQDGSILVWKFNLVANCFEPAASLKGHSRGVVSLVVGANRLYSGSMDNTIRVWNLETLQCLQTLTEHTSVVMSVLCWDQFLLSCSLDKTVKVWFSTESGNLEVTYTHNEEHGILTLCGMHDSQGKPILLCSCNDNTVRLYDLPSFAERGKILTKQEVRDRLPSAVDRAPSSVRVRQCAGVLLTRGFKILGGGRKLYTSMEGGENILDAIYEEDNLDDVDEDVEMVDIEEGELVEHDSEHVSGRSSVGGDNTNETDKKSDSKNRKRRGNRKKKNNKRKRNGSGPNNAFSIDRFVLDTCRRLKEKKSYMVYTAVGCLGVSALSDIVREVDAIQACGGQKTADGKRFRTGGGILWSIIKVREPQAYTEIMKKAKEFEKQFKHPNVKQPPMQKKEDSSPGVAFTFASGHQGNVSDSPLPASEMQDQHEPSRSEEKHIPVHDRLRIPVSYDDDLLGLSAYNDATDH